MIRVFASRSRITGSTFLGNGHIESTFRTRVFQEPDPIIGFFHHSEVALFSLLILFAREIWPCTDPVSVLDFPSRSPVGFVPSSSLHQVLVCDLPLSSTQ